jgi:dTDP-4-dehydrorhamnose reductase
VQKILITGSNGLLGQKLVNLFAKLRNYEVFALSRGDNRNETTNKYTYYNIDITDSKRLGELINSLKPHCIVNCAAMTNVDECQKEKEKCDLINVESVKTLVNCAQENNIHLIQISTDFIFDGVNGPYKEDDEPNPINYYGLSKLKSEDIIINSKIKYTILRTILVFGIVDNMSTNNIVLFVKNALENKQEVTMVDDQYRMPTFVDDLAQACLLSIQNQAYGVFHISSSELLSVYEMAIQIAKVFELDASLINRISTNHLNQFAKRPPKTGFDLEKSKNILNFPQLPFRNRLQAFKNQLVML